MNLSDSLTKILAAWDLNDFEGALEDLLAFLGDSAGWVPVGRENNKGTIESASDPGRSIVERITNGVDAVLEEEYRARNGIPQCVTPQEAAAAWLGVPNRGLSAMSQLERRKLAQKVAVTIRNGEGRSSRTVEIRDEGIGLLASEFPQTILSLNEGNKLSKLYLSGVYGQGGSSTFAVSQYTLIASRPRNGNEVAFSVVKYEDLPPDQYKIGRYVFLRTGTLVPSCAVDPGGFPSGTLVRHFGYDLTKYPSPLGPNSVYGMLNAVLFDPVIPIWLDNDPNAQRRVIKGSRNALSGAVDEGDDERSGPPLDHHVGLFSAHIADFGDLGIEYWVLKRPTKPNQKPSASFVNPARPIVLTHLGQSQQESSQTLIKKADLPFLTQRLIVHVQCDRLTPAAKRGLFVSNRESARGGVALAAIEDEVVRVLASDDELQRLNEEAKHHLMSAEDKEGRDRLRKQVARLIRRIHGSGTSRVGDMPGSGDGHQPPVHRPPRPPRPLRHVQLQEPPTYIKIVSDTGDAITFYPEQRRYIRIETDARSVYYDRDPGRSRINVISGSDILVARGTTPLTEGRMRVILECKAGAAIGSTDGIRVELSRPGLATLSDHRDVVVVAQPPTTRGTRRTAIPEFDVREVVGPDAEMWSTLNWPVESVGTVASGVMLDLGQLVVYYSAVFPPFSDRRSRLEKRDAAKSKSFVERYKVWIAVHALIMHDREEATGRLTGSTQPNATAEDEEERDRSERARVATIAAMMAWNEVEFGRLDSDDE